MRHPHMRGPHMRPRGWGVAAAAAIAALLAGCGGIPLHESDQEVRDRFNAYAGEPIDQFTWLSHFDSWQPVGRYDLVVFTNPSDAYLIKVFPPCANLQFANRIGVTSTADTVSSRFDSVIVRGAFPGSADRCQIQEIRKVDYRRMRADMRLDAQRAREAKAAAASQR